MFFTLQFPYIDLREFLISPPKFIPKRHKGEIVDFKTINNHEFIHHFGGYKLRNKGAFEEVRKKGKVPKGNNSLWRKFKNVFKDEDLYVTARRGLSFIALENQNLLGGKLYNPRAQ